MERDRRWSAARRAARRGAIAILVSAAAAALLLAVAGASGLTTGLTDVPDVTPIAMLVAIGVGFNGVVRVSASLFLAEGRPARAIPVVWATVLVAAVLVPLSTWLHGLAGAAVANLVVYLLLAVLYGRLAFRSPPS